MFISTMAIAECIPFFGVPGTVDGSIYTVETIYVYKPGPYYTPPPPSRHYFHHNYHRPHPHPRYHEPHYRPPRHPSPR